MRLAVLADIHGNPIALEAVLNHIFDDGGADLYLVLGDISAIGYDPVTPLKMLQALPNVSYVRGNTDRFISTGERPYPTLADVLVEPKLVRMYGEVTASFAWTAGYIAGAGWRDWMTTLPYEQRLTLPDGTRVLAVHASPGVDDGSGFHPGMTDDECRALLDDADADVLLCGHTHTAFDRKLDGVRIINPGSVSNPFPPDLRAAYALITADESGWTLDLRRVEYNHDAVIAAVKKIEHPSGDYIIRFQRGEVLPSWLELHDSTTLLKSAGGDVGTTREVPKVDIDRAASQADQQQDEE